jgi:hypothetical protein
MAFVVFKSKIGSIRSVSQYQSSLVLDVGGYVPDDTVVVLRMAAVNVRSRNLPVSGETKVVDSAGNRWMRAIDEIGVFDDGAPSQRREVWYVILDSALQRGDRITVKMPSEVSFDRAAAKASSWYMKNVGRSDVHFHLSRWSSRMLWHKGLEPLLAHGIDAHATGRRVTARLSIDEGRVRGSAVARAVAPNVRHDDVEAIIGGLLLLKNARRHPSSSNPPPAAQIRVAA